ncbi:MAG: polysaccharide biosynthesis/export family protein [Paludibacteraceae bacterium]|nr:polysaccharide biosynthesis/export family protein [Paludibacteraceae bacterium]
MKIKSILISAIVLLLASCVTSKKVNYMQEPDKKIPAYADTLTFEDYQLREGDRIYVYVYSLNEEIMKIYNAGGSNSSYMRGQQQYGNEYGSYELYSYLVDENGNIQFPTIGDVQVLGLTTREVKLKLEDELSKLLQATPGYQMISVEVNVVRRMYSIIGEQSGRYPITKEKMTIFEALAQAGDINEFGDRSQIKLIREKDGETIIKTFDVRSKDIINSEFYYIEPNDIIYIRKIKGQSFRINSAGTAVGVVAATISFGVFVYTIVNTGINHVNKYKTSK